jgi:hypothetical protein
MEMVGFKLATIRHDAKTFHEAAILPHSHPRKVLSIGLVKIADLANFMEHRRGVAQALVVSKTFIGEKDRSMVSLPRQNVNNGIVHPHQLEDFCRFGLGFFKCFWT